MSLPIKRVVTGVDEKGTSVVYEDAPLAPVTLAVMPGVEMFQLWATEGALQSPRTDPDNPHKTFFPGPGGTRFGLFRLPPETEPDPDAPVPDEATINGLVAEAEATLPGLLGVFDPNEPGMHQTVTVDYVIVIEGELWVALDDGVEVHLPTGSCVVQNGARHAWRNKSDKPATLAYVILAVS